ncbi:SPOR domain-containing protein [Helicobacter jaachi]|uniref:SPOR domain-containing protein n=1 Tax=Helicobacter jaachi TaxID=1677920 RepID=A0A4U8TCS1_9HELI|nr:SPOR domain-containing protein [Helicobacter jaachi]TLD97769.1 SPOR domain-containing protein [Helicobacter jaachi]
MDTKRELNDILINDDDLQKQNRTKKLMMMVAMALVFLCILIAVVFVITRDEEELGERQAAANNGLTPIESNKQNNDFVNVPLSGNETSEDPFQRILDDIRSRDPQNQAQNQSSQNLAQNTQPTQPIQPAQPAQSAQNPKPDSKEAKKAEPKPASQPNQPVLPAKPKTEAKPDSKEAKKAEPKQSAQATQSAQNPKPAQNAQTPNKPAQVAQNNTNNISDIFENVPAPRMDTSKNGQVAEKGFYVQVGSFANKPSEEFLKKISNYSYRVYAGTSNGQPTTKYLIGPYNSRTEASRDLPNFKTIVSDPVHFEVK